MDIKTAEFLKSSADWRQAPPPIRPEHAFVGRSNVGKSSLLNYLAGRKSLAKVSGKPGKTKLINHFLINGESAAPWYLVDLPGYGYTKGGADERREFTGLLGGYLSHRENLVNVFLLVDSRIPPQQTDLETARALGEAELPFALVFTKCDRLSNNQLQKALADYARALQPDWAELPYRILTSAEKKQGREEVLAYVSAANAAFWEKGT